MSKVLIIFSTVDGHTKDICLRLKQDLEDLGDCVTMIPVGEEHKDDLTSCDKIVIGASIRYGKHHAKIYQFIAEHQKIIESKTNVFFTVNVVARKPEKNTPETNPYLIKFLQQITWKPDHLAVFAGKIDYQRYRFLDRWMIRLIMWMTKGPTDPKANIDYTDWNQVAAFAPFIHELPIKR